VDRKHLNEVTAPACKSDEKILFSNAPCDGAEHRFAYVYRDLNEAMALHRQYHFYAGLTMFSLGAMNLRA
jgi:hypothetical protein